MKDSCRRQSVDYIFFKRGFKWIWIYSIICFDFCFVSCSGGVLIGWREVLSCYFWFWLVCGRTCILILLDEQRHLVWRFWANIRPFFRILEAVCIFPYLLVSCFCLACCRAVCFPALVKILAEGILVDFYCGSFRVLVFKMRLLISNKFSLFQRFRLGSRAFWRGRGTGPGGKDDVGRVIWWSLLLWSLFSGSSSGAIQ